MGVTLRYVGEVLCQVEVTLALRGWYWGGIGIGYGIGSSGVGIGSCTDGIGSFGGGTVSCESDFFAEGMALCHDDGGGRGGKGGGR